MSLLPASHSPISIRQFDKRPIASQSKGRIRARYDPLAALKEGVNARNEADDCECRRATKIRLVRDWNISVPGSVSEASAFGRSEYAVCGEFLSANSKRIRRMTNFISGSAFWVLAISELIRCSHAKSSDLLRRQSLADRSEHGVTPSHSPFQFYYTHVASNVLVLLENSVDA